MVDELIVESISGNELFLKLIEAQSNMGQPVLDSIGRVGKNGERTYKYASLASVLFVVRPALNNAGLFLSQHIVDNEYLETIVYSASDSLVLDRRKMKLCGIPREDASAETYAKRYALCSIFGLSGVEDDDGEAASTIVNRNVKADKHDSGDKVDAAINEILEQRKERQERFKKLSQEAIDLGIKKEGLSSWFESKGMAGKKVSDYTDYELCEANEYLQGLVSDKKQLESGKASVDTASQEISNQVEVSKVAVCTSCGNVLDKVQPDALLEDLKQVGCCNNPIYEWREVNGE